MNSMLQQIENQLEAKLKPEQKNAYDRIVLAGMKVLFSNETHDLVMGFLEKMGADLSKTIPEGIARLISLLHNESKNMPVEAAIPAAITLMLKAMEYLAAHGRIQLTPDFIAQCTQDTSQKVLEAFGITKDVLDQYMAQHQQNQGA